MSVQQAGTEESPSDATPAVTDSAAPDAGSPNAAAPNAAVPNAAPRGLSPADLASAYKLNSAAGAGMTVAIVDAYDAPYAESDLAAYRSQYGLPACTSTSGCFTKVNQNGALSPLPASNSGWAAEIMLDLDMVSAICPKCKILLVEANDSYMNNLGTSVNTAVRLGAKYVSNSYGGSDSSNDNYYDATYYNHPGVVITASAGDSGYGAAYPASSAFVTSVGGTTLTTSTSARGWGESAWAGSGSGCSTNVAKPSFQASVATGCSGRAVSDVSAVANPSTGVAVYYGGWNVYGGTSVSSPIIASVYALAGTPGTSDRANSYPYSHTANLFDVAAGSNGSCSVSQLCTSGVGWDGPTGLGSPNGSAAFTAAVTATPTPTPTASPTPTAPPTPTSKATPTPTAPPTPVPTKTPVPTATATATPTPVKLAASVAVTGTPVAGLASTVSVTTSLPTNDAVASIQWSVARTDCQFSSTTTAQTKLACSAASTAPTTFTAKVTDTFGATVTGSAPLTFATAATPRPVTIAFTSADQSGSTQTICIAAPTAVRAVVTDSATGAPVLGASVTFAHQSGTAVPSTVATVSTNLDGVAVTSTTESTSVVLTAKTAAANGYAAGSFSLAASAIKCVATVTAAVDKTTISPKTTVVVTGRVTRLAGTVSIPVPGTTVAVSGLGVDASAGKAVALSSAVTALDGSYSVVVTPLASGALTSVLSASTSWAQAQASTATVTINAITTALSATVDSLDVGYGSTVTASGTLLRNLAGVSTPLAGSTVLVIGTPAVGNAQVLATAVVAANGSWRASFTPLAATTLSASYNGAPATVAVALQPAATTKIGAMTVGTWTTAVSLNAQYSKVTSSTWNLFTGSVTKSYKGTTVALSGVTVAFYVRNAAGQSYFLGSLSAAANGSFGAYIGLGVSMSVSVTIAPGPGYTGIISAQIPVTVGTAVALR